MKKALVKFAGSLLSKDQMKSIKGGVVYCTCNGVTIGYPDGANCASVCSGGGGGPGGCEYLWVPGCG